MRLLAHPYRVADDDPGPRCFGGPRRSAQCPVYEPLWFLEWRAPGWSAEPWCHIPIPPNAPPCRSPTHCGIDHAQQRAWKWRYNHADLIVGCTHGAVPVWLCARWQRSGELVVCPMQVHLL